MGFVSSIRIGLGYVKRAIGYRSIATASLIHRNLPNIVSPTRPANGRIVADDLGLSLDPKRHSYYLPLLPQACELVREGGGSFGLDEGGDPEFRIGALRVAPENTDDLLILHEIFARRLYEIEDGREWLVLDVGMNVGYSALYFAGVKGWEVIAYEPFPSTFARAVRNVRQNGLSHRIDTRLAGVGKRRERIGVSFNEASRSTNGLFGNLKRERSTEDEHVEIEIVDAADAINEVLGKATGRPLLVKLDCEGAEYDIIDRLTETGLLAHIEAFIVEYHFIVPGQMAERIHTPLLEHGFLLKTLWIGPEAEGVLAVRLSR